MFQLINSIAEVTLAACPVFLLGVSMLMVTRWLSGPAPGDGDSAAARLVRALGWFLTVVGFLVGSCLFLPNLILLWFATMAAVICMAYSMNVATQRYAMLALVGVAAERSMPLERAFAAFGEEQGGWMRQRAAEIARLLAIGTPLTEAVDAVPGVLPPEAVPLVCVGYENGSLGPAVRQAITARNLYEPVWQAIVPKVGYICFLPAAGEGTIIFIIMTIAPQYEMIFKDFGTRLPDITLALFQVCRWGFIWMPLGFLWICASGLFVYSMLRYAGSIRWDLPGMDRLLRRRHIATVLDGLALATERQRPWGEALATLASSYPQKAIARRLWAVHDDLQAGGDALQCLHAHGLLGKSDLALLQSARRNGNLAWAAQEMADSNRRRFIYRTYAVLQVIFPMVIIAYGLLMAAIYSALFLPMINLILRLAYEIN